MTGDQGELFDLGPEPAPRAPPAQGEQACVDCGVAITKASSLERADGSRACGTCYRRKAMGLPSVGA